MKMLKIEDLVVAYGGIEALKGISLEVEEGQIVTLVGANGAGKSTTLRTVIGLVKPVRGRVLFKGLNLLEEKTHHMARHQITLVPEGRRKIGRASGRERVEVLVDAGS